MLRVITRASQALIDVTVLVLAYVLGFLLRFEWDVPPGMVERILHTLPYVVLLQYGVLFLFDVPRFAWRYVGLREVTRIFVAMTTAAAVLLASRFVSGALAQRSSLANGLLVPTGVILIDYVLAFLGIGGVRVVRRLMGERARQATRRAPCQEVTPILLVGAGEAGVMVAKELATHPDLGLRAVGFVDDDRLKHGNVVHGVPVLGSTDQIADICRSTGARQVLVTIAHAPGAMIRKITGLCEGLGVKVKVIPGLHELVGGTVNLSRMRDVNIEDLLRREPVVLDETAIHDVVRGRVMLVTGAGGSIGSELCRQICRFEPKTLVLVERAENNLFYIHRELVERFPDQHVVPCVGDVCDVSRMQAIFAEHRPYAVFHAAAHKHVPMMEWNPGEAVKNNVRGTKVLADLAHAHGVHAFVMISTDKAVNPTSVMGATKRVAEIYIQALSQRSDTRFVTVRFGNVLGSAGSVIPIFQEQIARGGPVTVTHPEMKRYFMTIPEACQLVLQAATMGKGGEIFILDMGEPVKIVDLARDLIVLSGLRPGEDIEIRFTGIRPGEKLFEELSIADEYVDKTRHPKIFVGRLKPYPWSFVQAEVDGLLALVDSGDIASVRSRLARIVPEYRPSCTGSDTAPATADASGSAEIFAPSPLLATGSSGTA